MTTLTWTLKSPVREKKLEDELYGKIKHLIDDEVEEYISDINLKNSLVNNHRTKILINKFNNLISQGA